MRPCSRTLIQFWARIIVRSESDQPKYLFVPPVFRSGFSIGPDPQTGRKFDTENFMNHRPNLNHLVLGIIARVAIALAFVWSMSAAGANAEEQHSEGSSSKRLRNQVVQSLPYHLLNQQTQSKIGQVLQKPSVYRRLPVTSIQADPDYFRFLTRNPEVVVGIWQLMGITNMTTERTGPFTVATNDGAGTITNLELVYGDQNQHIFYGTGTYEGPVLKRKLNGRCVMVLNTESHQGQDGRPITTCQLDVFLKIDNATAGLVAKTIAPLVGSTADHNFVQSLKFVQRLNETTEKNGPGVQKMGNRLDLSPEVHQKFDETVNLVFQRAVNGTPVEQSRITAIPASTETRYSLPVQQQRPASSLPTNSPNYQLQRRARPTFQNFRDPDYSSPSQKPSSTSARPGVSQTGGQRLPANSGIATAGYEFYSAQSGHLEYGQQHRLPPRGYQPPSYNRSATWTMPNDPRGSVQPIPAQYYEANRWYRRPAPRR